MNNDEVMRELLAAAPATFLPSAYYDPDGDCIEAVFAKESFFAQRVDASLTIYRSERNQQIVGSLIKGVTSMLRRHPNYQIDVEESGRIQLSCLIRLRAYPPQERLERTVYRDLLKVSEGVYVEQIPQLC